MVIALMTAGILTLQLLDITAAQDFCRSNISVFTSLQVYKFI